MEVESDKTGCNSCKAGNHIITTFSWKPFVWIILSIIRLYKDKQTTTIKEEIFIISLFYQSSKFSNYKDLKQTVKADIKICFHLIKIYLPKNVIIFAMPEWP